MEEKKGITVLVFKFVTVTLKAIMEKKEVCSYPII